MNIENFSTLSDFSALTVQLLQANIDGICRQPQDGTFELWLWELFRVSNCQNTSLERFLARFIAFILSYLIAALGAAVLHVFSLSRGANSTVPFLKKVFPEKPDRFYVLSDLVIIVFFGGLIGVILFNPVTPRDALLAGLGWFGAISAATARGDGD